MQPYQKSILFLFLIVWVAGDTRCAPEQRQEAGVARSKADSSLPNPIAVEQVKLNDINSQLNRIEPVLVDSEQTLSDLEVQAQALRQSLQNLSQEKAQRENQLLQKYDFEQARIQQDRIQRQYEIEQLQQVLYQKEKSLQTLQTRIHLLTGLNYESDPLNQAVAEFQQTQNEAQSLQDRLNSAEIDLAQSQAIAAQNLDWQKENERGNLEQQFEQSTQSQSQQLQSVLSQYQKLKQEHDSEIASRVELNAHLAEEERKLNQLQSPG